MREKVKSLGLILAIIIAGISFPTSIMSFMDKPTHITEINNYYYNTTVIERYNTTIIEHYNNTIIEYYNETVYINNTVYIPINRTIEYYICDDVQNQEWFLNITYDITNTTVVLATVSSDSHPSSYPQMWLYKDSVNIYNEKFSYSGVIGFIGINGTYDIKFYNPSSSIYNFVIAIERIEII